MRGIVHIQPGASDDVNYYMIDGSGMKDVHGWLKSLRLHKYSELFSKMTYEQMMSLTEEQLESKGVTKGARHKIILNINKLKNRVNNLKALEQSLDEEGHNFTRQALNELKTILCTPIKPYHGSPFHYCQRAEPFSLDYDVDNIENQYSPTYQCDNYSTTTYVPYDEDLPSYITRVIARIGSIIMIAQHADEECLKLFNVCTEKCFAHEAFTTAHKQTLSFWKQQIDTLRYSFPGRRAMGSRQLKGKWGNPNQSNEMNNNNNSHYLNANLTSNSGSSIYYGTMTSSVDNLRRTRPMGPSNLTQPTSWTNRNNYPGFPGMERSMNSFKKQNFHDHTKVSSNYGFLHRNNQGGTAVRHSNSSNSGQLMSNVLLGEEQINNYIESLCLRMTEQALGSGMDENMNF